MNLDKLCERWKEYVLVLHWGKRRRDMRLSDHYYKCEKTFVGRRKIPALKLYRIHTDDGTWGGHTWDVVRCDTRGKCYLFSFQTKNINKYYWKKCGIFVRAEAL